MDSATYTKFFGFECNLPNRANRVCRALPIRAEPKLVRSEVPPMAMTRK